MSGKSYRLAVGRCTWLVGNLPVERLQIRLSFLTDRFATNAPYWTFAIWGRQLLLMLPALLVGDELLDTYERELIRKQCLEGGVLTHRATCAAFGVVNATLANNTAAEAASGFAGSTSGTRTYVFVQAFYALGVLSYFWRLQLRFSPYPFAFQNRLESQHKQAYHTPPRRRPPKL